MGRVCKTPGSPHVTCEVKVESVLSYTTLAVVDHNCNCQGLVPEDGCLYSV